MQCHYKNFVLFQTLKSNISRVDVHLISVVCYIATLTRSILLKGHWQISKKRCSEKYCSYDKAWLSFIGHTLTKLLDKWRQISKQKSFYTSSDFVRRCWEGKIIVTLIRFTPLQNGCLIALKKCVHETDKNCCW